MRNNILQLHIGLLACVIFSTQLSAMDDWKTASIEEAGFSWDVGERLDEAFENGELKNLHSVLAVQLKKQEK